MPGTPSTSRPPARRQPRERDVDRDAERRRDVEQLVADSPDRPGVVQGAIAPRGSSSRGPARSGPGRGRSSGRSPRRSGRPRAGCCTGTGWLGLEVVGPAPAAAPAADERPGLAARRGSGTGPAPWRTPSRSSRAAARAAPCRGPGGRRSRRPDPPRAGHRRPGHRAACLPSDATRVKPSARSALTSASRSVSGRTSTGRRSGSACPSGRASIARDDGGGRRGLDRAGRSSGRSPRRPWRRAAEVVMDLGDRADRAPARVPAPRLRRPRWPAGCRRSGRRRACRASRGTGGCRPRRSRRSAAGPRRRACRRPASSCPSR